MFTPALRRLSRPGQVKASQVKASRLKSRPSQVKALLQAVTAAFALLVAVKHALEALPAVVLVSCWRVAGHGTTWNNLLGLSASTTVWTSSDRSRGLDRTSGP